MIIGIIADTHDCLPMITKAVKTLNERETRLVLHAGDIISPFTTRSFKPLKADLVACFGNNDGDRELLSKKFAEIGAEIRGTFAEILTEELRIAMIHGHEEELLRSLVASGGYNVVIYGHTHRAKVYRARRTLVVNPGEVCGYLGGEPTLAIFDTLSGEIEVVGLK